MILNREIVRCITYRKIAKFRGARLFLARTFVSPFWLAGVIIPAAMARFRWIIALSVLLALTWSTASALTTPRPSPVPVSQVAWFPTVSERPQDNPVKILFSVGSHVAVVDIELLDDVNGTEVCVQRSLSTPKDVSAWTGCTYYFKDLLPTAKATFSFNITDVEGNVPYYVNLKLVASRADLITSAKVYVTIDQCGIGMTRAIHHPDQCVAVNSLTTDAPAVLTVPANTEESTFYWTVNAPNNNVNEIVTGLIVNLTVPQETVSWQLYAAANMPPMTFSCDFLGSSTDPIHRLGHLKINTPSPGVWYLTLVVKSIPTNPEYNATIARHVTITPASRIGTDIPTNNQLQIASDLNNPNVLQLFRAYSSDGALYVSVSTLHPRPELPNLPYRVFVASNAVPGAFNNSVGVDGINVFADWAGCSINASLCNHTTVIKMPATNLEVTYIIGILPIGNFTGTRAVVWRDSLCPFCERGICQTTGSTYGTCRCPKGWTQIDCSVWGEKTLTPQIIVIIALMAFFAVFGLGVLIYVIYTKNTKGSQESAEGYTPINNDEDDVPLLQ